MRMCLLRALSILALTSSALAQNPPQGIQDEGGTVNRPAYITDCVGPAISCSHSGITGTITVDVDSADISDLSANNTEVLSLQSGAITGDSDFIYDTSTNLLDLSAGSAEFGFIGLGGGDAAAGAAINVGTQTSASLLSALVSVITYTSTSSVAAGFQSELTHAGAAISPTVWGALVGAFATSNNSVFSNYYGIQAKAGFRDFTETLDVGEIAVFYGISADVLQGQAGGAHGGGSTIAAIGIYVPNFTTPTNSNFIRHGILTGEPLSLLSGAQLGFNASVLANATTYMTWNATSSELETYISATKAMEINVNQIEPKLTIDGGRNLFYSVGEIAHDISAGWTDIDQIERVEDSYYSHLDEAADIGFDQDGLYRITYDACTQTTSGSARSESECKLQEDVAGTGYKDINESFCNIYNRLSNQGRGCCSVTILRDFNREDEIKLLCRRRSGSDTITNHASRTRINIEYIRDS